MVKNNQVSEEISIKRWTINIYTAQFVANEGIAISDDTVLMGGAE